MSFSRLEGMSFRTVEFEESNDPVATGLLGSIGVMILTNLVY